MSVHNIEMDNLELTGAQKCAVLCSALGKDFSSEVFKRLTEAEAEEIGREIARLDVISWDTAKLVVQEFNAMMRGVEWIGEGGVDYARELLAEAYDLAHADEIIRRIQKDLEDTGLNRLRKADADFLINLLRGEYPQTIALILAHIDPKRTADVIEGLEVEFGAEVLYRMARMDKVSPEMLNLIETSLGDRAALNLEQGMRAAGGPSAVAEVMNYIAGSAEKALLESLAARDPEIAEQVENLMFVFEDIILLDDRAIQRVLQDIEMPDLALCLKKASEEVKDKILSNMSQRAIQGLEDEMDYLGSVRVKDVEAAQAKVVARIRQLEAQGEIALSGGTGEDAIID